MALQDGVRIGGVYAEVGLDFTRLERDLKDLRSKLDSAGRDAKIGVGGSASGAAGGGMSSAAGLFEMRRIVRGVERTAVGVERMGGMMKSMTDGIDALVKSSRSSEKAAHDLFREQRRQYHLAAAQVHINRAVGTEMKIARPEGYARLPADVRYLSGAGFDQSIRASRVGATAAAAAAVSAHPGILPFPGAPSATAGEAHDMPAMHPRAGAVRPGSIWSGVKQTAGFIGQTSKLAIRGFNDMGRVTAGLGHLGFYAFNRVGAAIRGVELRAQRLKYVLGPIGSVLGSVGRAATAPFRMLGRVAGMAGGAAEAAGAAGGGGLLGAIGGGPGALAIAGGGYLIGAVGKAASKDETAKGLSSQIMESFADTAMAIGESLLPVLNQFMALIVDVGDATKGVTPFFVSMLKAIGNVVASGIEFLRKMISSWRESGTLIRLMALQMKDNFVYLLGYLKNLFVAFFTWLRGIDVRKLMSGVIHGRLEGLPEFNMPKYQPPQKYAEEIAAVFARIAGVHVRTPAEIAGQAKAKPGGKAGEIVGAQELYSMISRTAAGKSEDSKNHKKTADNTGKIIDKLSEMASKVGSVMF